MFSVKMYLLSDRKNSSLTEVVVFRGFDWRKIIITFIPTCTKMYCYSFLGARKHLLLNFSVTHTVSYVKVFSSKRVSVNTK